MTHALSINGKRVFATHYNSMMDSLAHRLEAAKADRNTELIELLEQEKQLLSAQKQSFASPQNWMQVLRQGLAKLLWGSSTLQVQEFTNGSDHWFYACDSASGRCVYADSDVELRLWIKANYQGR